MRKIPKMRNGFIEVSNMALYWISGIRPYLILETSHKCQKRFGDKREREELGFWGNVGDWCESLHVYARSCKEEGRRKLGLQVQSDCKVLHKP